jgi:hypothetical protein
MIIFHVIYIKHFNTLIKKYVDNIIIKNDAIAIAIDNRRRQLNPTI